jgi:YHS domain-containing protein
MLNQIKSAYWFLLRRGNLMIKNILIVALIALIAVSMWECRRSNESTNPTTPLTKETTVNPAVMPHKITDAEIGQDAICPVMGDAVKVTQDTLCCEYKGKVYYFCCPACPPLFNKDPDKYAK